MMPGSTPAVFLDRDGVLNAPIVREGKPYAPMTRDGLVLLPGVEDACQELKNAGFLLVMITNQPEISRGRVARETVDDMNQFIAGALNLDAVKLCPHDDADGCACRKPRPGLLSEAAGEFNIDLEASYLVGDRWRDVLAGQNAGCRTVFLDHGYQERQPEAPDFVTQSLSAAAGWIVDDFNRNRRNLS